MTLMQELLEEADRSPNLLRWYAIKMNETGYWLFEGLEHDMLRDLGRWEEHFAPRIEARYIASPDMGVHICSFERMAEAYYVESTPVWDEDIPDDVREYIHDWVMSGDESEPVTYYNHSRFFAGVKGLSGENFKFIGVTGVKAEREEVDDLLDYERCNPSF